MNSFFAFFLTILVLGAPLVTVTDLTDSLDPQVTKCFYVKGDQLCQHGRKKPLCRPLPGKYVESESIVYRNTEKELCVEKNTRTHVGGIVVSENRSRCGQDSDPNFQLAMVDLVCQTWDGPLSDMGLTGAPVAAQ